MAVKTTPSREPSLRLKYNFHMIRINKKYKTRHLILKSLFEKLRYTDAHFFNLSDSATSVEELASKLNTTIEELLTAHHGLTKHINCNCSSGKHIIILNADGIDAFIDDYWLREGQKDLNDKFYDRIKWIAPIVALLVTVASLCYTAYKTDRALKKAEQIQIDIEKLKTDNKTTIDGINSNTNKTEATLQKVEIINSDLEKLKNATNTSPKKGLD
jgi:hypothetical protein